MTRPRAPTLILTNDRNTRPKKIVGRYAQRMRIEQRLAESIRSFHLDALSSAVALNVDLDPDLSPFATKWPLKRSPRPIGGQYGDEYR